MWTILISFLSSAALITERVILVWIEGECSIIMKKKYMKYMKYVYNFQT